MTSTRFLHTILDLPTTYHLLPTTYKPQSVCSLPYLGLLDPSPESLLASHSILDGSLSLFCSAFFFCLCYVRLILMLSIVTVDPGMYSPPSNRRTTRVHRRM